MAGCGGGAALLHPAHVLPAGRVSAGAGAGGQFVLDERARSVPSGSPEQQFLQSAGASLSLSPGLSPWVGARAGITGNNEAGVTYTGRTLRVDGRHAFGKDAVTASIGAGASAVLSHPGARAPSAEDAGRFANEVDQTTAPGFGFDVPALVGWRSTPAVAQVWAGARGGMERVSADLSLRATGSASVTATRWYGGALVGFAVGVDPLWVALELDIAYQSVSLGADFPAASGEPEHRGATLTGVTLSPAAALVGKF